MSRSARESTGARQPLKVDRGREPRTQGTVTERDNRKTFRLKAREIGTSSTVLIIRMRIHRPKDSNSVEACGAVVPDRRLLT